MSTTDIYYEEDLLNESFCKKVIDSLTNEENFKIKEFLNKLSLAFIRESENFRREIINYFIIKFDGVGEDFLFRIGRDTMCGNIIILYKFFDKNSVIDISNIDNYDRLFELDFITESVLDLTPTNSQSCISFDDRLIKQCSKNVIVRLITLTELFFLKNYLHKSKDNFLSLLKLYESYNNIGGNKTEIFDSLINNNFDKFLSCIRKYDSNIKNINDFLKNYSRLYELLQESGIFVFFDFNNLTFNGVVYNKNIYPLRFLDKNKQEKILMSFQNIDKNEVAEIYDLNTESFAIPLYLSRKILISDVFSFSKIKDIILEKSDILEVKKLTEDEIIEKISKIIEEPNKTPHGPGEKADILTGKVKIIDDKDFRESAFIVKGKSFPRVNAQHVTHQILKSAKTNAQVLFLVITGNILDEARDNFIELAKLKDKIYCIIDCIDVAKIMKM